MCRDCIIVALHFDALGKFKESIANDVIFITARKIISSWALIAHVLSLYYRSALIISELCSKIKQCYWYFIILSPSLSCLGRLTPPLRLSSSPETAATLQLKWEPPFSLQGEKISYLLRARNLRSNMTIEKVAIGTWTTFKSPQEDHACDRYEFTVCSNNEVGLSDPCTAVNTSTPYGKQLF